jgi:hypothetical protein
LRKAKARAAESNVDPLSEQFGETFLDNRQRTPYASHVGEKTNPFEGASTTRAKSVRESWRKNHESDDDRTRERPQRQRSASVGESENVKPTKDTPRAGYNAVPNLRYPSQASARYSPRPADPKSAPPSGAFPFPTSTSDTGSAFSSTNATVNGGTSQADNPNVFTVPDDDDDDDVSPSAATQQARFMRNSTDNINTRFVAEEKAGESFMFNAGGPPSPEGAFMKAKHRSRSTPRGRQSSLRTAFTASSAESFTNGTNPPPKPSGFDAEEWTEKIGPHNFVPPQVTRTSASPTRQPRGPKKTKPVRMTAGTAGLVDDEHTSEEDRPRPTPSPANADGAPSPIPMDIDTPEPVPTPATPQPSGARNINVEPSKPEWRAGDVKNTQGGAKLGNRPTVPKPNPNAAGSEDIDPLHRPIFADFQNVEPFAPKPSGLGSFGDMKTNLPFTSKPSVKLPLQKEETKEVAVTLPPFPVCPTPPPTLAIANLTPSANAWRDYVLNFHKYLEEWARAEKRIHDHFAARDRKAELEGNQRFAWINTRGDAGCERYLRHLEEDKYIRQKWMAACEVHELRVRDFMKHREKMKQTIEMA